MSPIVFEVWDIHFLLFLFRNGHLDIVKYLVDGGHCQPNSMDDYGRTTLHYAARYVHQSAYTLAILHGTCRVSDEGGPLHDAFVFSY